MFAPSTSSENTISQPQSFFGSINSNSNPVRSFFPSSPSLSTSVNVNSRPCAPPFSLDDLRSNKFNDVNFAFLMEGLSHDEEIKHCHELARVLSDEQCSITKINCQALRNHASIEILLDALTKNQSVLHLGLRVNPLPLSCLTKLAEVLSSPLCKISVLELGGVRMALGDSSPLMETIARNRSIVRLGIEDTTLNIHDLKRLTQALQERQRSGAPPIAELMLEGNDLSLTNVAAAKYNITEYDASTIFREFGAAVASMSAIQYLKLDNCILSARELEALFKGLSEKSKETHQLHISIDTPKDCNLPALTSFIRSHSSLKTLWMKGAEQLDQQISDEGLRQLIEAVLASPSLQVLHLGKLGRNGLQLLLKEFESTERPVAVFADTPSLRLMQASTEEVASCEEVRNQLEKRSSRILVTLGLSRSIKAHEHASDTPYMSTAFLKPLVPFSPSSSSTNALPNVGSGSFGGQLTAPSFPFTSIIPSPNSLPNSTGLTQIGAPMLASALPTPPVTASFETLLPRSSAHGNTSFSPAVPLSLSAPTLANTTPFPAATVFAPTTAKLDIHSYFSFDQAVRQRDRKCILTGSLIDACDHVLIVSGRETLIGNQRSSELVPDNNVPANAFCLRSDACRLYKDFTKPYIRFRFDPPESENVVVNLSAEAAYLVGAQEAIKVPLPDFPAECKEALRSKIKYQILQDEENKRLYQFHHLLSSQLK